MTDRRLRFSPTIVLILVVLAIAAGAVLTRNLGHQVPGTLRLGVLAAESPRRVERVAGPLANWLGEAAGRAGEVVAPGTSGLEELAARAEVMLVDGSTATGMDPELVLAWARPVGVAGPRDEFVMVSAGGRRSGLCAVPVAGLSRELARLGASCDSLHVAGSPFAGRELLRALAAGGYDAVLVRASIVEEARLAGWLVAPPSRLRSAGAGRGWLALVASPRIEPALRNRVREAALNLDKYRLDPSHMRASSVLHALAEFGVGGFAGGEPFATLRR